MWADEKLLGISLLRRLNFFTGYFGAGTWKVNSYLFRDVLCENRAFSYKFFILMGVISWFPGLKDELDKIKTARDKSENIERNTE